MKKPWLVFLSVFLLLSTVLTVGNSGRIGSAPFFETMSRNHPLEIILDNGGGFGGMGWREHYGFPFYALIVDKGSSEARRGGQIDTIDYRPKIDSWRMKLDLLKLAANILFTASASLVLITIFLSFAKLCRNTKSSITSKGLF